jgi:hypothetical protein
LGGPKVYQIKEFVQEYLKEMKQSKALIPIHFILGDILVGIAQFFPNPFVVREQYHMLKNDMIVSNIERNVLTFEDLNIQPSLSLK